MAKETVADIVVDTLAAMGVRNVYGVAGTRLTGITASLHRKESIQWVHTLHEDTAALAAGARPNLRGHLHSALAAAAWAIPISSAASSTVSAVAYRSSQLRLTLQASRLMTAATAKANRRSSSSNAAIIANSFRFRLKCRECPIWRSGPRYPGKVFRSSSCRKMSRSRQLPTCRYRARRGQSNLSPAQIRQTCVTRRQPFDYRSNASALPQAISAQSTFRFRHVIAMRDIGGFSIFMGDFLTLAQTGLPVNVVVDNIGSPECG